MKKLLYLAFLATVLAGCAHDEIVEPSEDAKKIYASIADAQTRVQLNDNLKTVWTAGDKITVLGSYEVEGGTANYTEWLFDGQTGDRDGSFSLSQAGNYPGVDFGGNHYAFYGFTGLSFSGTTPVFFSSLPAEQSYLPDSYGLNSNIMYGTSEDGSDFTFSNVPGYLCLRLAGDKVVESITLSGNNGETISGRFYFPADDIDYLVWYDGMAARITLDCGDGVQLTDDPIDFYFSLLPVCFSKGITVVVDFTDGTSYPQSTTKSITIERNTIQPMAAIQTGDTQWQTVEVSHTGTLVSAPYLTGETSLSGFLYWGDGTSSVIGSVDSYVYTDSEPSHTLVVKVKDADTFSMDSCEGVTRIDFSQF